MKTSIIAAVALLAVGCANLDTPSVISTTGTVIGVEIAYSQTTQMPTAKLGYNRGEFAWVPLSPGWVTPNVVQELTYSSIFDMKGASIHQRMAVGDIAVAGAGTAFMFAKNSQGALDPQVAEAISRSLAEVPAPDASATASKLMLGKQYSTSIRKEEFDAVASSFGYANFKAYLIEAETPIPRQAEVKVKLMEQGLYTQ